MARERGSGRPARRFPPGGSLCLAAIAAAGTAWSRPAQAQSAPVRPEMDERRSRDVCAEIEARLERRRQWLAARRIEQFARGGAPDPDLGIPDVTWQWCEAHPEDVDCNMPRVTVFFTTEELRGGQAPEEYDPHVILMKRELRDCRGRARAPRP